MNANIPPPLPLVKAGTVNLFLLKIKIHTHELRFLEYYVPDLCNNLIHTKSELD